MIIYIYELIFPILVVSESSLAEMRKVLLMILGCAVQCEKKEEYVDIIKTLDISVQQALVVYIKEVSLIHILPLLKRKLT